MLVNHVKTFNPFLVSVLILDPMKTPETFDLKPKKSLRPLFMRFFFLKATEPLQRDSLLFTIKFPEISGGSRGCRMGTLARNGFNITMKI